MPVKIIDLLPDEQSLFNNLLVAEKMPTSVGTPASEKETIPADELAEKTELNEMAKAVYSSAVARNGAFIPKQVVTQMVQNFADCTYKLTAGAPVKINPQKDSYSVWFNKTEIDQLFYDNNVPPNSTDYGIRIYLGMHKNTAIEAAVNSGFPAYYMEQHNVILVVTKTENGTVNQDLLKDGNYISGAVGEYRGLDEGSLCPPPTPCQGSDINIT